MVFSIVGSFMWVAYILHTFFFFVLLFIFSSLYGLMFCQEYVCLFTWNKRIKNKMLLSWRAMLNFLLYYCLRVRLALFLSLAREHSFEFPRNWTLGPRISEGKIDLLDLCKICLQYCRVWHISLDCWSIYTFFLDSCVKHRKRCINVV